MTLFPPCVYMSLCTFTYLYVAFLLYLRISGDGGVTTFVLHENSRLSCLEENKRKWMTQYTFCGWDISLKKNRISILLLCFVESWEIFEIRDFYFQHWWCVSCILILCSRYICLRALTQHIYNKSAWQKMSVPQILETFKWCWFISVSPWRVKPPTSQKWASSSPNYECGWRLFFGCDFAHPSQQLCRMLL